MSIIIVIIAVALLALLEKLWTPAALKALHREGRCDHVLAEPGEELTWTSRVENRSRLPIPFVRLHEELPIRARLIAAEQWILRNCRRSDKWWHIEQKFSLRPRLCVTKTIRFSLPDRGRYRIGGGRLSVGDLLGFREAVRNWEADTVVIMPERSQNARALDAAGGFLGDISVRRFILDDPILTVGFRDYTGREPMKSISWTRTAMTGALQVKQFDHTSEQTAVVLLNVRGASGAMLEECFRLTRSVCEQLEQKKIPFALRTNGNLPGPVGKLFYVSEGLGSSHLNTILYGLGCADSTSFYSFRTLARQALRSRKQNDAYIIVTPPLEPEDRAVIGELEAMTGNPVCVLEAELT